jgi:vitamin B12 transport system substrate-binding protein
MMTIGENAWANKALAVCNAQTIFVDSPSDYPEVRMAEVLIRQPQVLITTLSTTSEALELFWQPHRNILSAPIVQVDGAIINRFTPRITSEIASLCESLRAWR